MMGSRRLPVRKTPSLNHIRYTEEVSVDKEINKLDPEIQQQVSLGTFGAAMPIKVN